MVHTIERFATAPSVDAIVAVVPTHYVTELGGLDVTKPIRVVSGGRTRAESVANGLNSLENGMEIVAVHDGARPFVSIDEIEKTIAKARETGAACLVGDVTDTIKTIRADQITGTLDRTKLRRALTPQVFKVDVLRRAFEAADLDDLVTDECYLVEALGHPIAFVEGSSRNIKITHPEDIALAEAIAKTF